jgi:hypothetical protein
MKVATKIRSTSGKGVAGANPTFGAPSTGKGKAKVAGTGAKTKKPAAPSRARGAKASTRVPKSQTNGSKQTRRDTH